jgi:hypothetical protein
MYDTHRRKDEPPPRPQGHGVARLTAAKALRLLESEGIVERIPGLGYYVK